MIKIIFNILQYFFMYIGIFFVAAYVYLYIAVSRSNKWPDYIPDQLIIEKTDQSIIQTPFNTLSVIKT